MENILGDFPHALEYLLQRLVQLELAVILPHSLDNFDLGLDPAIIILLLVQGVLRKLAHSQTYH